MFGKCLYPQRLKSEPSFLRSCQFSCIWVYPERDAGLQNNCAGELSWARHALRKEPVTGLSKRGFHPLHTENCAAVGLGISLFQAVQHFLPKEAVSSGGLSSSAN